MATLVAHATAGIACPLAKKAVKFSSCEPEVLTTSRQGKEAQ